MVENSNKLLGSINSCNYENYFENFTQSLPLTSILIITINNHEILTENLM